MEVSHVALVMNKNDNLFVYKNKGRPTTEYVESIKMNGDLRKELAKLEHTMKYKYGTEILLALYMSSDEIMQAVCMFPEVGYMDVTSNTNKEGCDLHLLVAKDANVETYMGCATMIPSW